MHNALRVFMYGAAPGGMINKGKRTKNVDNEGLVKPKKTSITNKEEDQKVLRQ